MQSPQATPCGRPAARRPVGSKVSAGPGQLLADGELRPNSRNVLIQLGSRGDTAIRDPIKRRLPDVAGHAEGGSGQLKGSFCHITIISDNM